MQRLLELLSLSGESATVLDNLHRILTGIPSARDGISELRELAALLDAYAVPAQNYRFDFTMVRGLGYYTGPIYEAVIAEPNLGSISGGGRYDDLIGHLPP